MERTSSPEYVTVFVYHGQVKQGVMSEILMALNGKLSELGFSLVSSKRGSRKGRGKDHTEWRFDRTETDGTLF